jgi:hypothetical protein
VVVLPSLGRSALTSNSGGQYPAKALQSVGVDVGSGSLGLYPASQLPYIVNKPVFYIAGQDRYNLPLEVCLSAVVTATQHSRVRDSFAAANYRPSPALSYMEQWC